MPESIGAIFVGEICFWTFSDFFSAGSIFGRKTSMVLKLIFWLSKPRFLSVAKKSFAIVSLSI